MLCEHRKGLTATSEAKCPYCEVESLRAKLAAAEDRVKELESGEKQMTQALDLALEYWRHRQQRYKNRNPVWVEAAREARRAAIERSK